jgi:hypothetical protein
VICCCKKLVVEAEDSSGTQRKGKVRRWKLLPEDWRKQSRLSMCSSELQIVWNSETVTVTCSHGSVRIHLFIHSFIRLFIHKWLCSLLFGPGLFFSFVVFLTQTAELLGRVISSSQDLYLHTGQYKHRINSYTDIRALSGIRTHEPSVRASEDSSCLRPCGHYDRLCKSSINPITNPNPVYSHAIT